MSLRKNVSLGIELKIKNVELASMGLANTKIAPHYSSAMGMTEPVLSKDRIGDVSISISVKEETRTRDYH